MKNPTILSAEEWLYVILAMIIGSVSLLAVLLIGVR